MKQILSFFFIVLGVMLAATIVFAQPFNERLQSARKGEIDAMVDVGVRYFHGKGTLKDPFKAKCWIQKAYNLGSEKAATIWEDLELWQYSGKCELAFDDQLLPRYVKGDTFVEPVSQLTFVWVPRTCFDMGCHDKAIDCKKNETPSHRACLDGFWIGAYEVDQKTWTAVMGDNPSRFYTHSDHPVENVSFDDVQTFLFTLNRMSRHQFSLPTEAQWEAACRNGGQKENFPWEGDGYRPQANCGNCQTRGFNGQTAPVGSFPPNAIGLFDMGGNVKEWCADFYDKRAYASHSKKNPEYKDKTAMRVVRGGSYTDNTIRLRCTARDKSIPTMRADNLGFRLVLIRSK
jgi:formylglycine-generating enzyme required for sulfatase activity